MAGATNVVCSMSFSAAYFKWTFVLLLFFVCRNTEAAEECDFLKCVQNAKSFIVDLRRNGASFTCRKFLNISGCSDYCMHEYYPNIFLQSDTNSNNFTQYCIENIAHRSNVNWSCIARHTFRLLTCLANISSMTSNSVREDAVINESCRKSFEFSNCPSDVLLSSCGQKSVEVVKDMLQFAVDYFMSSSCKEKNIKKIFSMPVHYYLGNEFMNVARCFDRRLVEINACFQQMIQTEMDLHAFVCGDEDFLSDCIHFQVAKNCEEVPSVRTLLLKIFSLGGIRCKQSQFAFTHLSSYQFQDSVATKSASNKMHAHSYPPLNDKIYDLPDSHSDETSTLQLVKNKDQNITESPASVYSVKDETRHEIDSEVNTRNQLEEKHSESDNVDDTSSFDFKKIHGSDSFVKNPSEKPSHKDRDHFKASSSVNLCGDRTSFTIVLFLIILSNFLKFL